MKKGAIGGIALAVILFVAAILFAMCSCLVPAGYVAVQYDLRNGVRDEVLTQGLKFVSPTVKTSEYTVGVEQGYITSDDQGDSPKDESFEVRSSEGKNVSMGMAYTYRFDPDRVSKTYTLFRGKDGETVNKTFIKPNIVTWAGEVIPKYTTSEILGDKIGDINNDVTSTVKERFDPYGIIIEKVSLIVYGVDAETMAAINNRIAAQQEAEAQEIKNKTEIGKAEAEAKAAEIRAEGEANANNIVDASLTDKILELKKYEKWNGNPTMVSSGSDTAIVVNPSDFTS